MRTCDRLAARLSQAFTATEPSVTLSLETANLPIEEDIIANGSTFSDGIGEISQSLANEIARALRERRQRRRFQFDPSAYQFRCGGMKGVLVINPALDREGRLVRFRKSQKKFECMSMNLTKEAMR